MNLEKLMEEAYKDRAKLEHLKQAHNLQWHKVIQRILNDHFNKQIPMFG